MSLISVSFLIIQATSGEVPTTEGCVLGGKGRCVNKNTQHIDGPPRLDGIWMRNTFSLYSCPMTNWSGWLCDSHPVPYLIT
jgi:hypothetical protein